MDYRYCKTAQCSNAADHPVSRFCCRECQVANQVCNKVYSRIGRKWNLDPLTVASFIHMIEDKKHKTLLTLWLLTLIRRMLIGWGGYHHI